MFCGKSVRSSTYNDYATGVNLTYPLVDEGLVLAKGARLRPTPALHVGHGTTNAEDRQDTDISSSTPLIPKNIKGIAGGRVELDADRQVLRRTDALQCAPLCGGRAIGQQRGE